MITFAWSSLCSPRRSVAEASCSLFLLDIEPFCSNNAFHKMARGTLISLMAVGASVAVTVWVWRHGQRTRALNLSSAPASPIASPSAGTSNQTQQAIDKSDKVEQLVGFLDRG